MSGELKIATEEQEYRQSERLNQSSLKVLDESVQDFKRLLDGEYEFVETENTLLGDLVHCLKFEPDEFDSKYRILQGESPSHANHKKFVNELVNIDSDLIDDLSIIDAYKNSYSTKGKSDDKIVKESKALYERFKDYIESYQDNRELISEELKEKADSGLESITNHPIVSDLLSDKSVDNGFDKTEMAIDFEFDSENTQIGVILNSNEEAHKSCPYLYDKFITKEETIPAKAKIDKVRVNFDSGRIEISDLKTMGRGFGSIEKYFKENNHHLQAAFYIMAVIYYLSKEYRMNSNDLRNYEVSFNFVGVNMNKIETKNYILSHDTYQSGIGKLMEMLERYVYHTTKDKWEATLEEYEDGGIMV